MQRVADRERSVDSCGYVNPVRSCALLTGIQRKMDDPLDAGVEPVFLVWSGPATASEVVTVGHIVKFAVSESGPM